MEDLLISNNLLDGCGLTNFWQPGAVWVEGLNNISVLNNEVSLNQMSLFYFCHFMQMTNTPYMGLRIAGQTPHGSEYWAGITEPSREDYIFHIEYNHIHHYGQVRIWASCARLGISFNMFLGDSQRFRGGLHWSGVQRHKRGKPCGHLLHIRPCRK